MNRGKVVLLAGMPTVFTLDSVLNLEFLGQINIICTHYRVVLIGEQFLVPKQ